MHSNSRFAFVAVLGDLTFLVDMLTHDQMFCSNLYSHLKKKMKELEHEEEGGGGEEGEAGDGEVEGPGDEDASEEEEEEEEGDECDEGE